MPLRTRRTPPDRYLDLVVEFPLRRINSPAQHEQAKRRILALSARRLTRGETDYLDVLVDLVADYEKRAGQTLDTGAVDVAELVRHRLAERGLSLSALARRTGLAQSNLSEMVKGKRDWSKTAIRVLSAELSIRPDRFLT